MSDNNKKPILVFIVLAITMAFVAFICMKNFFVTDSILPVQESPFLWNLFEVSDKIQGGASSIKINDFSSNLDFNYVLSTKVKHAYASVVMIIDDSDDNRQLIDLSKYSVLSFRAQCSAGNDLSFSFHTFDDQVTDVKSFISFRIARQHFSCNEKDTEVEIDLRNLKIPVWWLSNLGLAVSDQSYMLDRVRAISFTTGEQSPTGIDTRVTLSDIALKGYDWYYVWIFICLLLAVSSAYCFWLYNLHIANILAELKTNIYKDQPFASHRKIIESYKDKEKARLLHFMVKEFKNPGMSLGCAVTALGINRTKINEILKEEFGLTFIAYLNKLRLAEAARLLLQDDTDNVVEISRQAGYNNVTYFIKLFKGAYGKTPKRFKGESVTQPYN